MTGTDTNPDVLIVGAGPSGSALATLMARRGWTVMAVDRSTFPRPKPCGEFISPGALQAAARLGVPIPTRDAGALIGWALDVDGVEVRTRFSDRGASLPRARLDQEVLRAARRAGAQVLEGSSYLGGGPETGVRIRTAEGVLAFRPTILVGAGGLRCPVSRTLRKEPAIPPRKISLSGHVVGVDCDPRFGQLVVRGGLTVGLAPSDPAGTIWNATIVGPAAEGAQLRQAGAVPFFFHCLARAGIPGTIRCTETPLLASSGFRLPSSPTFVGRTVLIGDSQGYFDPFTGQGIYQALRSAEILAPWLHLALAGRLPWERALDAYRRRVVLEKRRTQRLQRAVETWLASGPLRLPLSRALSRVPGLFGAIMEATTDQSSLVSAVRRQARAALRSNESQGEPLRASYLEKEAQSS